MGNENSRAFLDLSKQSCSIRGMRAREFPFSVIPDHPLQSLDISVNEIRELPRDLTQLKQLDYSFNNLGTFSESLISSLLTYTALRELKLTGNLLTEVPEFLERIQNLTTLSLNSNKIQNFLVNLPNLEVLDLTCNLLTDFEVVPPRILKLSLAFNRIVSLDFTSSTLKMLNLAGNDIRHVPNGTLFESLTEIDLSFNKLNSISTIATVAPKLQKLSAGFNFIEEFPMPLPETIEEITLSTNRITTIPDLSHFSSLKRLKVDRNFVKELPGLPASLEFLDVDHNRISQCTEVCLKSMKALLIVENMLEQVPLMDKSSMSILSLRRNRLFEIDTSRLCQTLTRIDLTNNNLKSIPGSLFSLPQLKQLILSCNQITEIPKEIEHCSLLLLNISENPVSTLPPLPPSLSVFVGSCCKFESVPATLARVKRLSAIDMSNNKLKTFPNFPGAEYLVLSCNCIDTFDSFSENIRVLDLSHNRLTFFKADDEYEYLKELDISFNLIDNCDLGPLPELRSLRASHNPNLRLSIKLSDYPTLDCLDISGTQIKIQPEERQRIRELICDGPHAPSRMYKTFTDSSVGYAESTGNRSSMEDSLIIQRIKEMRILAVIDGHGGPVAATTTACELPALIQDFSVEGVAASLNRVNAFMRQNRVPDGATIALVVQKGSKIIAANIGDSRALIVRDDKSVVPLGYDHKPYERSELEGLRERGSFVLDDRVGGVLAISRALGDFALPGVSATPCLFEYEITDTDKYIVIACDGVFDVISNDEVGAIIADEDCSIAAYKLRNAAFARSSDDNISVIVAPAFSPA